MGAANHGRRLVALTILAGVLINAVLIGWIFQSSSNDRKLCTVLKVAISVSLTKSEILRQHPEWQNRPDRVLDAQQRGQKFLDQLPC